MESLGGFGVSDYDGPETIRSRKYLTGTHVLLREVEVETGATPGEVVWECGKARLYRYGRSSAVRRDVPILLTYGFVLKPYVLDLVPGNSLVEYLVDAGFDVYVLDFGVSGVEDRGLSIENLVLDYIHGAARRVLEVSGAEEVSLFGQSQGGTLCAMYAALFPDSPLKNLVLLSAPTEFAPRDPGMLGMWTYMSRSSGAYFEPAIIPCLMGNLPTDLASKVITSASSVQAEAIGSLVRPFGQRFGGYDAGLRGLRKLAERDVSVRSWLAVSKWVDDAAPFPGEVFRQWVKDFYQGDKLAKGKVSLRGRTVDLEEIKCSVLNISGEWDYVVPAAQTKATTRLARSEDKQSVSVDAGHVGMLVGPGADEVRDLMRDWLAPRSGARS